MLSLSMFDSIHSASESIVGCDGTTLMLQKLNDGIRAGQNWDSVLESMSHDGRPAFDASDLRIKLINVGTSCGRPDVALKMAANLDQLLDEVKAKLSVSSKATPKDTDAFLYVAFSFYLASGYDLPDALAGTARCFLADEVWKDSLKTQMTIHDSYSGQFEHLQQISVFKYAFSDGRVHDLDSFKQWLLGLTGISSWFDGPLF